MLFALSAVLSLFSPTGSRNLAFPTITHVGYRAQSVNLVTLSPVGVTDRLASVVVTL